MSKFLFAPFMMNLGESQRLSNLANCLYELVHDIHILGDNYYPFLFNNDAYRYHHCVEDKSVYNSKRYDAFFSLSTDFNFLSEEEIERICSIERDLLRQEKFDAVLTGYRLSIVTSCRLESIPLIWIISGATHISEIVENSEGILPNGKISKASKPQTKDFIKRVITTYSTNVKTWNNYIKKYGGKPFN
ncbi:cylJ protein, partial [Streptococcus agalactiae]|nr:cylJ protein [Streptococcus agalactiae]